MTKPLTAAAVEKLKEGSDRREIPDGGCPGLRLIIQPSGHKSWAMRFRKPDGTLAKLTLGPLDLSKKEITGDPVIGMPLTLVAARRLATEVQRKRAMGRDVVADRARDKLRAEARAASSFAAAAKDFIEGHAKKKTRRWQETARLLGLLPKDLSLIKGGLAYRWQKKAIADIDGHDIHAIIEETRKQGAPGLQRRADGPTEARARAMLAALSKMFSWLLGKRRVESNPCDSVHRPDAAKARDRVLTPQEIVKFWKAAEAERKEFAAILKLLLLTGSRLNEVTGMSRAELSDDGATWTLPGERTKNRRPHVVPLPPLARKLIPEEGGELVFSTNKETRISGWSKIKSRLDATMKIAPWRLHDLRRTAATGMAELGIAPHIIEAVLNHVSGARASVAGTYNRAAYAPEKKAALERWAEHVEGLIAGRAAKILPLRGTKGSAS